MLLAILDNIFNQKHYLKLTKEVRKWLRKEKRCEIYTIKKNFHIELNHVKNLGWFVERDSSASLRLSSGR